MVEYVAGFLFKNDDAQVLLIRKNYPPWQSGKLNGVGGKVEAGETPEQAMRREFLEEAGIHVPEWREFCQIKFHGDIIYFMRAYWTPQMGEPRSITSEPVMWKSSVIFEWAGDQWIPNLAWLIPMAKDKDQVNATVYHPY